MPKQALLLSIRPEFAQKLFEGRKTVELRRVRPHVRTGDWVLVYVSSPVKALVGGFEVRQIVGDEIGSLWRKVRGEAGITLEQFKAYYAGASVGFGIFLQNPWEFQDPLGLNILRKHFIGFHPPQGYQYLGSKQTRELLSLVSSR